MMGFNNIIGHEEIIGHLKNAIESGKISHSYIFTGEPGSGKKAPRRDFCVNTSV
mgnify:CR=1 FL=1